MSWFLAVLALAGWWQALRINRNYVWLQRLHQAQAYKAEQENNLLRHQLAAAQRWQSHE